MKTPSIAPEATVLGVDSSTQSTKALVVYATTGRVLAEGRAPHPPGTEVDPRAWLAAADAAVMEAVAALPPGTPPPEAAAVGGQQHGMVLLDAEGRRPRSTGWARCRWPRSPPRSSAGWRSTSRR